MPSINTERLRTLAVVVVFAAASAGCPNNLPPPANAKVDGQTPIAGDASLNVERRGGPATALPAMEQVPGEENISF